MPTLAPPVVADGEFADWPQQPPLIVDPADVPAGSAIDLRSIRVTATGPDSLESVAPLQLVVAPTTAASRVGLRLRRNADGSGRDFAGQQMRLMATCADGAGNHDDTPVGEYRFPVAAANALAELGLEANDARVVSGHLPVVVDLVSRRP